MRPNRTPPLPLLAALAALVSGCAEELADTSSEPLVEEDAEAPLAADGATEGPDSVVDPMQGRIYLTISTTDPLLPDADVALTVSGVAQEPVDGGEVVLTLPTRALMDHAGGKGLPELPVKARWDLPPMAEGDMWSASYTVPGEAAGWYRVMANAYTHGPDGGPWLFDDVLGEAWMHVSETDGRLDTHPLEDSVAPMAGPAAGWPAGPLARRHPDYAGWHPDTTYLRVVYSVSQREGFKPAVGATVEAREHGLLGPTQPPVITYHTVPEDGIVAFYCWHDLIWQRREERKMWGNVHAFDTRLVQGRRDMARWNSTHCGEVVEVEVLAHRYYPWRLLNLAADTLTRHFGHTRDRINWGLHFEERGSYYKWAPFYEKITLAWLSAHHDRFRWVVAHEYGHALHHKALGGIWWRSPNCGGDDRAHPYRATSYPCALQEGFADYAGTVGSVTAADPDGYHGECLEYLGTPGAPSRWCRNITHHRKPEIEWWVAALFMDLIDDNDNYEGNGEDGTPWDDETHYSGYYVAGVFKSCEAKRGSWPDRWKHRSKVYDFVWCLEEYVHKPTHEEVFPDTPVPDTAKHKRPPKRPDNWDWADIRSTWLRNLAR